VFPNPTQAANLEPLLVNTAGSWANRPDAVTRIPNLFLASDYVRTHTDLATMEAANEAAPRGQRHPRGVGLERPSPRGVEAAGAEGLRGGPLGRQAALGRLPPAGQAVTRADARGAGTGDGSAGPAPLRAPALLRLPR
jgi:hypothetical protein